MRPQEILVSSDGHRWIVLPDGTLYPEQGPAGPYPRKRDGTFLTQADCIRSDP